MTREWTPTSHQRTAETFAERNGKDGIEHDLGRLSFRSYHDNKTWKFYPYPSHIFLTLALIRNDKEVVWWMAKLLKIHDPYFINITLHVYALLLNFVQKNSCFFRSRLLVVFFANFSFRLSVFFLSTRWKAKKPAAMSGKREKSVCFKNNVVNNVYALYFAIGCAFIFMFGAHLTRPVRILSWWGFFSWSKVEATQNENNKKKYRIKNWCEQKGKTENAAIEDGMYVCESTASNGFSQTWWSAHSFHMHELKVVVFLLLNFIKVAVRKDQTDTFSAHAMRCVCICTCNGKAHIIKDTHSF